MEWVLYVFIAVLISLGIAYICLDHTMNGFFERDEDWWK